MIIVNFVTLKVVAKLELLLNKLVSGLLNIYIKPYFFQGILKGSITVPFNKASLYLSLKSDMG